MDLSLWSQSRNGRGAASCRPLRSWPWVGAQVASPRCPILRPGLLSVSHSAVAGPFRSPGDNGSVSDRDRRPPPVAVIVPVKTICARGFLVPGLSRRPYDAIFLAFYGNAHHDSAPATLDRGPSAPQPLPQDHRGLRLP